MGNRHADSYTSTLDWVDNDPGAGGAHFYFTIHYNATCTPQCTNSTYLVTSEGLQGSLGNIDSAFGDQEDCYNQGFPGWSWVYPNWGQEAYSYYHNSAVCAPGNSRGYVEANYFGPNYSDSFIQCFNANDNCPGDYVKY